LVWSQNDIASNESKKKEKVEKKMNKEIGSNNNTAVILGFPLHKNEGRKFGKRKKRRLLTFLYLQSDPLGHTAKKYMYVKREDFQETFKSNIFQDA
jgi:hypothetical protein